MGYHTLKLDVESQSVQKESSYLLAHNSPHYRCVHTPGNIGPCHISLVSTAVDPNQPKWEMCSIQHSIQITVHCSTVCYMETMSHTVLQININIKSTFVNKHNIQNSGKVLDLVLDREKCRKAQKIRMECKPLNPQKNKTPCYDLSLCHYFPLKM
jgi:hypothetical protein